MTLEQGASRFHFALGPTNWVCFPGFLAYGAGELGGTLEAAVWFDPHSLQRRTQGIWVAQSVKCLPLVQVMIPGS